MFSALCVVVSLFYLFLILKICLPAGKVPPPQSQKVTEFSKTIFAKLAKKA